MQNNQNINDKLEAVVKLRQLGDCVLEEEKLLEVLSIDTHHPQANYALGELMLHTQRVFESLPYFNAALEAAPQKSQYWLAYIQALIEANHLDDATLVLSYGREAGLDVDQADRLLHLIERKQAQASGLANVTDRPNAVPDDSIVDELIRLFAEQRYQEVEARLSVLLADHPNWMLG